MMSLWVESLKESNEFLNNLIENIPSAVFLVDEDVRLQEFNGSFIKLFSRAEQDVLGQLCGNAIGCAFAVEEKASCGETSNCGRCAIRKSILRSMTKKVPSKKESLIRSFYIGGSKRIKYFQFSTQHITFKLKKMVMVVVDDITEIESQRIELQERQRRLDVDLLAAAGIQRSLLPQRMPVLDRLRFHWKFVPCERIGGDIFNVVSLPGDKLACYMLDVSGHGVPAAMVTVSVS